jgi:phospholipid transport system transporter-binding protein
MRSALSTAPPEVVSVAADRLAIRGVLTFETAQRASDAGLRAMSASTARRLAIDCAGVTAADSAGLAVCLVWLAWAQRDGRELALTNLPARIRALARISDLEPLIDASRPL